jgi:alpha-glucosidase
MNRFEHSSTRSDPAVARSSAVRTDWWRSAVIYQVYPRSFADADGDGVGDLPGVRAHLDELLDLGVDAIWLSPFMRSPQRDAGYDVSDYCDVDPLFGTLDDVDALIAEVHERGMRIIIDLVPNHSSDQHPWFQAALRAGRGSRERSRYLFRDGRGPGGDEPPNNWTSVFGGDGWTRVTEPDGSPGQWYLHVFDESQPDFDWNSPDVRAEFRRILRFWLDRGVDGIRVDSAHGLVKKEGLPDHPATVASDSADGPVIAPFWGQPGVHEIYRDWRRIVDSYPEGRMLCAEVWMPTADETAKWVRPDEMHQAFNFPYLGARWRTDQLRAVIDESIEAYAAVGAPSTWVLSNHDVVRHATRLALPDDHPSGEAVGPRTANRPDARVGLRRARAATALTLALPGSAYLYQGEELGLPDAIDLPDEARRDPLWFRTNGEHYGRDGCRVPIPWVAEAPAYGFSPTGATWLPQPAQWRTLARDVQRADDGSTLQLYRHLLRLRREWGLGVGDLVWDGDGPDDALAFRNGGVRVVANLGSVPLALGCDADVLVASGPLEARVLPPDTTVWMRAS